MEKAVSIKKQYDLVACSGGDGTLDEVVTGMMMRENKTPIGYIPAGTTNDFASSLHISKNMLEAADTVVNRSTIFRVMWESLMMITLYILQHLDFYRCFL